MAGPSRVVLGATLAGRMLDAFVLVIEWDEPVMVVRFQARPWSGFPQWRSGGYGMVDGTWGPVEPIWPHPDVDPLEVANCTLSASAEIHEGPVARFCGECGTARMSDGRFCGNCGAAFGAGGSTEALQLIRDIAQTPKAAGSRLAAVIGAYADFGEVSPEGRQALLDLITSDFANPQVESLDVDVEPDLPLTLRKAQDVRARVASGDPLSDSEQEWANLILTRAPLVFGYWGPFKALLKAGPLPGLEAAHGTAVGRLSRPDAFTRRQAPVDVQDLSLLSSITIFPHESSFTYMRRRARRELAALGRRDPDTYTVVAEAMLLSWDQPLTARAFAPAYVLRGPAALRAGSRSVDLSTGWQGRTDPHAGAWDAHLGRVQRVFDNVRQSPDAFTWAYQVLDERGRHPRITPARLPLALASRHRPLCEEAARMAPDHPAALDALSEVAWLRLLRDLPLALLSPIVAARLAQEVQGYANPAVVAARRFITRGSDAPERLVEASRLYLLLQSSYWRPNASPAADEKALKTVLIHRALRVDDKWREVLRTISLEAVASAFWDVEDMDPAVVDMLTARIKGSLYELDVATVMAQCMRHPRPSTMALLWQIIDQRGFASRRWEIERALAMPDLAREGVFDFLEGALTRVPFQEFSGLLASVAASGVQVESADVVRLLVASDKGRAALWEYLGSSGSDWITDAALANDAAIAALGAGIMAPQALSATGHQTRALQAYITAEPSRCAADPEFLIAAARNLDLPLQQEALAALARSGHLPRTWLQLAESAMPSCLSFAREYVESLRDSEGITKCVLACLDSQVPATRQLGLDLLYARQPLIEDSRLWEALSESDEPAIQRLVAEQALVDAAQAPSADFDRRILTARRRNRGAKQAVMHRLDHVSTEVVLDPDRIAALVSLARSSTARDRDWALGRLAILGLSGVPVEGVQVTSTSRDSS